MCARVSMCVCVCVCVCVCDLCLTLGCVLPLARFRPLCAYAACGVGREGSVPVTWCFSS